MITFERKLINFGTVFRWYKTLNRITKQLKKLYSSAYGISMRLHRFLSSIVCAESLKESGYLKKKTPEKHNVRPLTQEASEYKFND